MTFYVVLEGVISFLLVAGGFFALIGSLGIARLHNFFMRLHRPTKAGTLSMGSILIASMMYFWVIQGRPDIREVLVTLLLFITAPASAYLLAKTGRHIQLRRMVKT